MDKQCSICGNTGRGIEFRSGYVCEECLEYIKADGTASANEHTEGSNEIVNGSEIEDKDTVAPGIRHIISVNHTCNQ